MRPSELVGLEDPYQRYCFDEAVFMWGRFVRSELDKAGEDCKDKKQAERKIEAKLRAILHPLVVKPGEEDIPQPVPKGRFRDPMSIVGKQGK